MTWLCNALGVSRSGFHAWLNRSPSAKSRSDEAIGRRIRTNFISSDRTYGARRIWRDLLAKGIDCGLHGIERLMRLQTRLRNSFPAPQSKGGRAMRRGPRPLPSQSQAPPQETQCRDCPLL